MKIKKDSHGANLFELARKYKFDVKEIRDFSSNINPLGNSEKAINYLKENLNLFTTYPDPEYFDLKNSISTYTKIDEENIILGSGTTDLICNYIRLINPKKALLLSPCYSEYENELKKINAQIFYYNLKEERNFKADLKEIIKIIKDEKIELFAFANPNNPTGSIFTKEEIEDLLKNESCNFLIDETYVEFTDIKRYTSLELIKKYKNFLAVRSTSKFFASPGIRLGYGISGNEEVLESFSKKLILWGVNIAAEIMGKVMFLDRDYEERVYKHISKERKYMISHLKEIKDLKVYESQGNFILVKILNGKSAKDLREYLLKEKMVIRDCASFKNLDESFFRFCLLKTEDNRNLLRGIEEFFKNKI